MTAKTPRNGTLAHAPDLDWSQVRETVLMLELAAGQVEAAMRDSNTSVEVLTGTFTSMAETLSMIDDALDTLPDTVGNGMVKGQIRDGAREIADKVHQSIIAFQFYDKLVQRLDHVCRGLEGLSGLVNDKLRLFNPKEWTVLQEQIRSKYTMVEERAMFDAVIHGMSVEQALEQYMDARMKEIEESGGEVELF